MTTTRTGNLINEASIPRQEKQVSGVEILTRAGRDEPTPVYGTATPPRGLSGYLKRRAYAIPENRPSHWMLLLASDRVDVLESALRDPFRSGGTLLKLGVVLLGSYGLLRLMNRD
jgi:hypothetical protein